VSNIAEILGDPTCKLSEKNKTALGRIESTLNAALGSTHQYSFQVSVDPSEGYSCTISEFSKIPDKDGKYQPTKDGTFTITIGQTINVVTLSIGPLFSGIQNRTYSAVTAPNAGFSGTKQVLGVQGESLSTSIGALVNLRVPIPKLSGDKVGVDVSAGPVLRLNSATGTSPLGFFGGSSLRLYRYLFITPGLHVGQFADFPQGFSQAGQVIPPNFGTLTPVTRTTVKFGLAISFQTKDFSALTAGKTTGTSTTAPAAKGPSKTASPPTGNPSVPQPSAGSGALSVTKQTLDFGQVKVNDSKSLEVTITNGTTSAATLNPASDYPDFKMTGCGGTVHANGTCTATVTFAPKASGAWSESITITTNTANQTVQLKGTGIQ
jgi:hypothetical protein